MCNLLIRNAEAVVTMSATRAEIAGCDVLIRGGVIAEVGQRLQATGTEVLEARGCVVTAGLVNTHHHLYQTLTRAVPGGQNALLFWLAENTLSDLGEVRAGGNVHLGSGWPCGTGAFGLHLDIGSPLSFPERVAAG